MAHGRGTKAKKRAYWTAEAQQEKCPQVISIFYNYSHSFIINKYYESLDKEQRRRSEFEPAEKKKQRENKKNHTKKQSNLLCCEKDPKDISSDLHAIRRHLQ